MDSILNVILQDRKLAFLDLLASHYSKGTIDLAGIEEEANSFVAAATDAVAIAISWTIYELGKHEKLQQRVLEEVDTIQGEEISSEDLQKLTYLEMVLKESLRLHSPAQLTPRYVEKDLQVGEHLLPEGAECLVMMDMVHKNPTIYPDPLEFDPERFSLEKSARGHPQA